MSTDLKETIVTIHKDREGYKTIAAILGLPVATVQKVIGHFKAHGHVANTLQSGRLRKISPMTERRLVRKVSNDPRVTTDSMKNVVSAAGEEVSTSTNPRNFHHARLHS